MRQNKTSPCHLPPFCPEALSLAFHPTFRVFVCLFYVQHPGFWLLLFNKKSTSTLFSQKSNPCFLCKCKLKNICQHWFSRLNLRGWLLTCFWMTSTFQVRGMRESLDAGRLTEHAICAEVPRPHEGTLLLRISASSSRESMMWAGRSLHSHRLFSGRFYSYTTPALRYPH